MKNQEEKNSNERSLEEKELILANLDKSKTLGEKLKKSLKYKKMTYRQFAKLIDKSGSTVSSYANNRFKPSIKMIHKFEEILEVPFQEYYFDMEDINKSKTLGEKLGKSLKYRDMTHKQFADLIDKKDFNVRAYINNKYRPSEELLHKFEEILEIPFKEYYSDVSDMDDMNNSKTLDEKPNKALEDNKESTDNNFSNIVDYANDECKSNAEVEVSHQSEEMLEVSVQKQYSNVSDETKIIKYSKTFGKDLKSILNDKGITQERFAELMNKNVKTINAYANDRIKPSVEVLHKMEEVLGVPFKEYYPYIPDIDAINASKTFREKLKKALKYNNGMTCVELADLMDKEPKDVYAYTTHRRKPTIEEFHQLEEILGVSFEEYYPYMPTLADVNAAETLGEKLRRALIYKKISVKKLAKLTHRSQNNIYSYINNKYKPSARLLYLLEGILGISFKEYYLGLA